MSGVLAQRTAPTSVSWTRPARNERTIRTFSLPWGAAAGEALRTAVTARAAAMINSVNTEKRISTGSKPVTDIAYEL